MSENIKDQNLQVLVEVIAVDNKSGKSKSGSDYSMEVCQCIVRGEKVLVGELILPKGHPIPAPGLYRAEFEVAVSFDKRINGALKHLIPVKAAVAAGARSTASNA